MNTQPTANTPVNQVAVQENVIKGTIFSLGAIVAGVVLWLILWRLGFIASIVAFAIAWLAVKLYTLGAGTVSRRGAIIVVAVSVVGVVVAFLAGMASDLVDFIADESKLSAGEIITKSEFWDMYFQNITTNGDLWKEYLGDLGISILFAGLGMFWTLKGLFVKKPKETSNKKI